ncbi:MAG: hypothetical protein JSV00_05890 [bacterium]|nr:MAG: hypothetical protein JSV00_05890 [bacterium]
MKMRLLQFLQHLAASVFIGIAVYGLLIFYPGGTPKKIPASLSLLLGLASVVCIFAVVYLGGIIDRQAALDEKGDSP